MIEVTVTQVSEVGGSVGSRMIGIIRLNDSDASVPPEMPQPIDGRALAVIMSGLRKIAADYAAAHLEFGDPNGG